MPRKNVRCITSAASEATNVSKQCIGNTRGAYRILVEELERDHLEGLHLEERIILKRTFKKLDRGHT